MTPRIPHSLYKSFFDNSNVGLAYCQMFFDTKGAPVDFKYILTNKNYVALTGLAKPDGKMASEVVPFLSSSNSELFTTFAHVALTGESVEFETYIEPISQWFLISTYSNKRNYFVASFLNITERKRLEKGLKDAHEAARNVLEDLVLEKKIVDYAKAKDDALLQSIGEGVVVINSDETISMVNPEAERIVQYSNKYMVGKPFFETISLTDVNGVLVDIANQPILRAIGVHGTSSTITNFSLVRKDGTRIAVAITASPVKLNRRNLGAIIVFRDITIEKLIDRSKTEFVSLASHQLRTPLSAIRWYSEMLLNGDVGVLEGKQLQYIQEIFQSNLRMIELVNSLLNISRLEVGVLDTNIEDVDIRNVVQEVVLESSQKAEKRKIHITIHSPATALLVHSDRNLIHILIQNLVVNAVKYTLAGGSVTISLTSVMSGKMYNGKRATGQSIGIEVTDTGIGIPEAQKLFIFTKLFRADNARLVDTDGNGLGLYLARKVAEHTGGQLWFSSTVGVGSTFFVLLPVTHSEKIIL